MQTSQVWQSRRLPRTTATGSHACAASPEEQTRSIKTLSTKQVSTLTYQNLEGSTPVIECNLDLSRSRDRKRDKTREISLHPSDSVIGHVQVCLRSLCLVD